MSGKPFLRKLKAAATVAWFVLAWITFLTAFWIWIGHWGPFFHSPWKTLEYSLYMSFRAFSLDGAYSSRDDYTLPLVLVRWSAFLLVMGAGFAAAGTVFRAQVTAFRAAFMLRGHTLIVGDHLMADALAAEAVARRLRVVRVTTSVQQPTASGRLFSLPRPVGESALERGQAARARRVIVAEKDLGASIEGALAALKVCGGGGEVAKVAVHLDDPIIAERLHHAPGGVDIYAFSEAQASARAVMLRHPPFLLARRMGASAAHILIVGFGRLGQALARDLALNNLTSDLGPPHVTVLDPNATAVEQAFLHKHPEFRDTCRFTVVADLADLSFGDDMPPVCAAYVCLRDSADSLSAAITLRERASRFDQIRGPIFARLMSGGPLRPPAGVTALEERRIYSFGALADAASSCRALDDDPDLDARAVHAAYAAISGTPAAPWATLAEEMRVSNRRVLSHIPAKLASLGFDLEAWLTLPDSARPWPPSLASGQAFYRDDADREAAARLEHDRWMADRRLNGWRYGPKRDNDRKIQTYLIPFDQLPEDVQAYDAAIVDWIGGYVTRALGVLARDA